MPTPNPKPHEIIIRITCLNTAGQAFEAAQSFRGKDLLDKATLLDAVTRCAANGCEIVLKKALTASPDRDT